MNHIHAPTTDNPRARRGAAARVALAGVAILGFGVAATTAAFTNDAWFRADTSAGEVQLQGSASSTIGSFVDADTAEDAVDLTVDGMKDMLPGQIVQVPLYVRAPTNMDMTVTVTDIITTGEMFGGSNPATATVGTFSTSWVPGGGDGVAYATLTITAPSDWNDAYQGTSGEVLVRVVGATMRR